MNCATYFLWCFACLITRKTFLNLANSIATLFPGESASVYYVSTVRVRPKSIKEKAGQNSDSKKSKSFSVLATGRLWYKYTNTKKRSPVFTLNNTVESESDNNELPINYSAASEEGNFVELDFKIMYILVHNYLKHVIRIDFIVAFLNYSFIVVVIRWSFTLEPSRTSLECNVRCSARSFSKRNFQHF